MIKLYYKLTKPGIIYGNSITAVAGFFLASKGHVSWLLFVSMLVGLSLIIGSACVFNNYYDRDIDGKMERTKNRAMVTGAIDKNSALIFGTVLFLIGGFILSLFTNPYCLTAALVGFLVYVVLYTPLKRKTTYATLIGAVAGATPPVVGYAAVVNKFDVGALILFLILVAWQMVHFYAISIYRLKDYAAVNMPIVPVKKGTRAAKIQMVVYAVLFLIFCQGLTFIHLAGITYGVIAGILGLYWLWLCLKGFKAINEGKWAKKVFLTSLIILTILSVVMALNSFFP